MNDVKDLLERALADRTHPGLVVDPTADLARGRARLRRRRTIAAAGAAAVVLGVGFVPVALHNGSAPADRIQAGAPSSTAVEPKASGAESGTLPALSLVAYQGKQIPGYRVAQTPKGWEIQGGDAYALVIAPKGAKDKDTSSYVGKLVVMLQSKDASPPDTGKVLEVNGRPARLDVQGDTQILTYQAADERWMVIQAPTVLGWTGTELAEFASGVEVLTNAQAGVG
jgi:hypothetical protein